MVVILDNSIIQTLNLKNIPDKVKIINIKNQSTVILFHGKKIEIPQKLDINKKYSAVVKDNKLIIKEKKIIKKATIKKINSTKKEDFLKKIDSLLENVDGKKNIFEKIIKYFNFFQIYSKINKENENQQKKQYFINKNNDDSYYFVFNIKFYEKMSKVFIKINNKDVYLNIYTDSVEDKNKEDFFLKIKERLSNVSRNTIINFSSKKDDFYSMIYKKLKKESVDLKI